MQSLLAALLTPPPGLAAHTHLPVGGSASSPTIQQQQPQQLPLQPQQQQQQQQASQAPPKHQPQQLAPLHPQPQQQQRQQATSLRGGPSLNLADGAVAMAVTPSMPAILADCHSLPPTSTKPTASSVAAVTSAAAAPATGSAAAAPAAAISISPSVLATDAARLAFSQAGATTSITAPVDDSPQDSGRTAAGHSYLSAASSGNGTQVSSPLESQLGLAPAASPADSVAPTGECCTASGGAAAGTGTPTVINSEPVLPRSGDDAPKLVLPLCAHSQCSGHQAATIQASRAEEGGVDSSGGGREEETGMEADIGKDTAAGKEEEEDGMEELLDEMKATARSGSLLLTFTRSGGV